MHGLPGGHRSGHQVSPRILLTAADIASLIFWMLVMCIGVRLLFEFLNHRPMTEHVLCAALMIGVARLLKPRRAQGSNTSR